MRTRSIKQTKNDIIQNINSIYEDNGLSFRIVGGYVRDLLLNRSTDEIDAATNATPTQSKTLLEQHNIRVIETGIAHGTITARLEQQSIEITTLRKDIYCDGRHAKIQFTDSWEEDALRRDFTINALSMDKNYTIYDYTTGFEDIEHQYIRFIGDAQQRIKEDYLRILRFFRFYASHGNPTLAPDKEAMLACSAEKSGLSLLSAERIQNEMLKLLSCTNPIRSLENLHALGIDFIISGLNWQHIQQLSRLITWEQHYKLPPDPLLRLAVITNTPNQDNIHIIQRWKGSRAAQRKYQFYCQTPTLPLHKTAINLFLYDNTLSATLAIAGRDYATNPSLDLYSLTPYITWQKPNFPISGNDIIASGYPKDRTIGEQLDYLKNLWLQSNCTLQKEALLDMLRSKYQLPK